MVISCAVSNLKSVDLPTFGRPTMPMDSFMPAIVSTFLGYGKRRLINQEKTIRLFGPFARISHADARSTADMARRDYRSPVFNPEAAAPHSRRAIQSFINL